LSFYQEQRLDIDPFASSRMQPVVTFKPRKIIQYSSGEGLSAQQISVRKPYHALWVICIIRCSARYGHARPCKIDSWVTNQVGWYVIQQCICFFSQCV